MPSRREQIFPYPLRKRLELPSCSFAESRSRFNRLITKSHRLRCPHHLFARPRISNHLREHKSTMLDGDKVDFLLFHDALEQKKLISKDLARLRSVLE